MAKSKKDDAKGGCGPILIAVIVVGVIISAVAALWGLDNHRNVQRVTRAAHFTDQHVILVREPLTPVVREWTYDLWWVSLKDGSVARQETIRAESASELQFWGASQDALWFFSPYNTIVVQPADLKGARTDLTPRLAAHPTASSRVRFFHADAKSVIVTDETGKMLRIFKDGKISPLEDGHVPKHSPVNDPYQWQLIRARGEVNLEQLAVRQVGVAMDHAFRLVRPREGGGFIVIGSELRPNNDDTDKDVVLRVDDKGNTVWTLKLSEQANPEVGRFQLGEPHTSFELRGVHTTPGRVWIAYEISIETEHQTRLLEVDAKSGRVLRSLEPRI